MKKNISALILVSLIFIGCTDTSLEVVDFSIADKPASVPSKDFNELRNAYFGDLHVHTRYSFDAYVFGTTASPDDAYRYANCLLYTSPSPRDNRTSRMPSSA